MNSKPLRKQGSSLSAQSEAVPSATVKNSAMENGRRSYQGHKFNQPTGIFLEPSKRHDLAMVETERLRLNVQGIPVIFTTDSKHGVDQQGSSLTLPVQAQHHKEKQSKLNFLKFLKSGKKKPREAGEASMAVGQVAVADDSGTSQVFSMNVCRRGQTLLIPASNDSQCAYICEVVSPDANENMLVIQSTLRIFNYTDIDLDIGFYEDNQALEVDENIMQCCTCHNWYLGDEQPIDPKPYSFGLHSKINTSPTDKVWRLPSGHFASVPACLRSARGRCSLKLRTADCNHWRAKMFNTDGFSNGDVHYYELADGEVVRLVFLRRRRIASSVVHGTGRKATCCDVCVLPGLCVASMCPLRVDVQISVGRTKLCRTSILNLAPA